MMAPRKEINGNQQDKNLRKAEAATDWRVFIEGSERAGCEANPEACEKIAVSALLIVLMPLPLQRLDEIRVHIWLPQWPVFIVGGNSLDDRTLVIPERHPLGEARLLAALPDLFPNELWPPLCIRGPRLSRSVSAYRPINGFD